MRTGECRGGAGGWVGVSGGLVPEVFCERCVAQLAAAPAPAAAGAEKSVRGALGLAEATGERVRCFVVRCGWSMRRTFCGTSGSCENKGCQRMQLRE